MISGRTTQVPLQSRSRNWSLIRRWGCKSAPRKWHMRRSVGGCRRWQGAVRVADFRGYSMEIVQFLLVRPVNPVKN